MNISPKVRFSLIWLGWVMVWAVVLVVTKIELIPCQTFVYDSTQGYYNTLCPIINEDAHFVLVEDTSGYESRPFWLTWVVSPIVLLGIPAVFAVVTSLIYHRVSLRPKA